jgi:hypothetical protein
MKNLFDADAVADALGSMSLLCLAARKVELHCFDYAGVMSVEMTKFSSRALAAKPEELQSISRTVFGETGSFSSSAVLLAMKASRVFDQRAVYLHANDAYNSAAYCTFVGGELEDYEVVNWLGTDSSYKNDPSKARSNDGNEIFARGWQAAGGTDANSVDEVFELFYTTSKRTSFTVIDEGALVEPPRRL